MQGRGKQHESMGFLHPHKHTNSPLIVSREESKKCREGKAAGAKLASSPTTRPTRPRAPSTPPSCASMGEGPPARTSTSRNRRRQAEPGDAAATRGRCRRPRSPTPTAPPSRPNRQPRRSSWTTRWRRLLGAAVGRLLLLLGARRGRRPW
jgi:hypothetical protein